MRCGFKVCKEVATHALRLYFLDGTGVRGSYCQAHALRVILANISIAEPNINKVTLLPLLDRRLR